MKCRTVLGPLLSTFLAQAAWPQAPPQATDKIITFDAPGAGTSAEQGTTPMAINQKLAIVGYYLDSSNVYHGYLEGERGSLPKSITVDNGSGCVTVCAEPATSPRETQALASVRFLGGNGVRRVRGWK